MDIQESLAIDISDLFEEAFVSLRLPAPASDVDESALSQEAFAFNMEESFNLYEHHNKLPLPLGPNFEECDLLGDNQDIDDTNPHDEIVAQNVEEDLPSDHISNVYKEAEPSQQLQGPSSDVEEQLTEGQLEQIINYLVQFSNLPLDDLRRSFQKKFPLYSRCSVVQILMEKFVKIKKTKEELIKYCMRKAFKFILQLPKNKHALTHQKSQKFSFSKCKNRYLKYSFCDLRKVSEEKSMNNKFLQQIFSEGDFSDDYRLFLQSFEEIMIEDNEKKVKYLAWLLTNQSDGKKRSIEVVKRLPWTHFILQKVRKISLELLKFASNG